MKIQKCSLVFLGVLLLFTGCGQQTTAMKENETKAGQMPLVFTEVTSLRMTEPYGSRVYNSCKGYACEYEGIYYEFPDVPEEETRTDMVQETERLLQTLETETGIVRPAGMQISFVKEDYAARIEEHTLYIGKSLALSQEYAVGVAQAYVGAEVKYGLVYGLGCAAWEHCVMGNNNEDGQKALPELSEALDLGEDNILLDLNYACFLERYAGENVDKVKKISRALYETLSLEDKKMLFGAYTDQTFYSCLNRFLEENGQTPYENKDIWGISMRNGGEAVRLFWENEYADFYLLEDYHDVSLETKFLEENFAGYGKNPMNGDYADLRSHIIAQQKSILAVREKLGKYLLLTEQKVPVVFMCRPMYVRCDGQCIRTPRQIECYTVGAFQHEYLHHLLFSENPDMPSFLREFICHGMDLSVELEGKDSSAVQFSWACEKAMHADSRVSQTVTDFLGHKPDWTNEKDATYAMFVLFGTGLNKSAVLNTDEKSEDGYSKRVFYLFLLQEHGEDLTLQAILNDAPEQLGYSSWEDAVETCREWIDANVEIE